MLNLNTGKTSTGHN